MREQDDKLNSISKDLQRIKSSLSAISFDVIRNQSLDQSNAYDSDLLVPKSLPLKPIPQNSGNQSISINSSNAIFASNFEEFKQYIRSIQENLDSAELQIQKNIIMNIKKSYAKLIDYIQTNNYQEFGFQSFLLIDAIFIFILQIFNQKDPNLLNQSLEKKYNLLKNLPLRIDGDLILFLDRINNDLQNQTSDTLKIGEKTGKKLLGLINDVYKPFITIFED